MTLDIKTLMFKNNIRQKEFADFCGISLRSVTYYFDKNKYNNGNGLPTNTRKGKNIKKLAEEFAILHKLK